MQYAAQYFSNALQLINNYDGSMPLSHYLKDYFKQHQKFGSKDRKQITHICYTYYRLGFAVNNLKNEDRLKAALYLIHSQPHHWKILFDEHWLANWKTGLNERISFLQTVYPAFDVAEIFPFQNNISDGVNANLFALSFLKQSKVFLRLRPGNEETILYKLQQQKISFESITKNCIAFESNTKLDEIFSLNKEAVIQDYSSQRISEFLQIIQSEVSNRESQITVWDCCAASGGKSLLAYDIFKKIQLTVSDVRASIMHNLKQRFKEAGINNYKSFVADVSHSQFTIHNSRFDLIICDAPCSGSGTWARTPEQLYFFTKEKLQHYITLQKNIIANTIRHVKKGGYFLYITCSVFKEENENMVEHILEQSSLKLIKQEILKGYEMQADTMFAALFTN